MCPHSPPIPLAPASTWPPTKGNHRTQTPDGKSWIDTTLSDLKILDDQSEGSRAGYALWLLGRGRMHEKAESPDDARLGQESLVEAELPRPHNL